jgi:hypothetical protein
MRVLSYDECADRGGICRRTFERTIADGDGPPVVEISARRRGILETDFEAWLLARRRPVIPNADIPVRRGPGRPVGSRNRHVRAAEPAGTKVSARPDLNPVPPRLGLTGQSDPAGARESACTASRKPPL